MEQNEHIKAIRDYIEVRDTTLEKMKLFNNIMNNDFEDSFDNFICRKIPAEEVHLMNENIIQMSKIRHEMFELSLKKENTLEQIEEKSRLFVQIATSVGCTLDKILDYYEEYNVGGN